MLAIGGTDRPCPLAFRQDEGLPGKIGPKRRSQLALRTRLKLSTQGKGIPQPRPIGIFLLANLGEKFSSIFVHSLGSPIAAQKDVLETHPGRFAKEIALLVHIRQQLGIRGLRRRG